MRAVFRCDASVSVGIGHVMRCLAFAETLAWTGWSCGFATARESLTVVPSLTASGFDIGAPDEGVEVADLAVFDHYRLDADAERRASGMTVAFDDLADRPHDCAILVDPTPGRRPSDYAPHVPQDCRLMLGPKHAILRAPWLAHRATTRDRLAASGPVEQIVVSMGGTDPYGATVRLLRALEAARLSAHVHVILGSGAPGREEIARLAGPRLTLHQNPADPAAICAAMDLAIGAPGTSSFERAVLGLPAILIPLADNQRFVAAAFATADAAQILPAAMLDDPEALGAHIAALAADGARRVAMSRNAAALTDGRGRFRLLAAIAGVITTRTRRTVQLRAAETRDEAWLLDLQSQDATRRYARNPAIPTAQEHAAWLSRVLDDPERLLMVIKADGAAVGMLRLDRVQREPRSFEVSIAIDAARHGEGLGRAALALARRLAPGADLIATVKAENQPSLALFAAAGYRPDGHERFRSRAA